MYPPPQQFIPVYAAPIHHQHHHTLVNLKQHTVSPPPFISPLMTPQSQAEFTQLDFGLAVPMFQQGEYLIECINKAMAFLAVVATRPRNVAWFKEKLMLVEAQDASQILDEKKLAFLTDSDCDDLSSAKAVLMAILSSCDLEFLSELPYFNSYLNDMINQDVQEMQYSEQTHVDNFKHNEIHSCSNIISYS
nr:hypothetical protein [Tanacetum cinerariifolium]